MPDASTPGGDALGYAPWLLSPADEVLVARLLARFGEPATLPWAWLTSPAPTSGPRPCTILVSVEGARRVIQNRGILPPDSPSHPWAGWGRLYAPDEVPPPDANISLQTAAGLWGTVRCLYQRITIVPERVYAEYLSGVMLSSTKIAARTRTVFIWPYEAKAPEIKAV